MAGLTKEQTGSILYRATFERTEKKMVDGVSRIVTLSTSDPEDPALKPLVANGKFGYLRVTDADTGKKVMGLQVSALQARDVLRGCLKGTYKPFKPIRNKRREIMGAN